jgi:rfaE bifunctional protein nucleotidyltransferase chain/domain
MNLLKMSPEFDPTNWRTEKLLTLEQAAAKAEELKAGGKRLVTVNGSFDIVHAGHLDQLEEAKKQGDVLFIGINSDASVREGKGEGRPYIPEHARAALLAALVCIDFVIIIDAPYDAHQPNAVPKTLLRAVKPHVHVNGPDYGAPETWLEWPVMQELGVQAYSVQKRNMFSTSDIVRKIKDSVD